jgi:hypothetical protein
MTVFTNIFGGNNILPSGVSYAAVTLSQAITIFSWPTETSSNTNILAGIMDVTSPNATYKIQMPDATQVSTGQAVLFTNISGTAYIVTNSAGTTLLTVAAGTTWQLYLTNNTTSAGSWQAFQFGAQISAQNAAALAGTGIIALGSLLSQAMPIVSYSTNLTITVPDRALTFLWTGGVGTFTLPLASTAGDNWFIQVKNAGSGTITVAATGANTIDTQATVVLQPLDSCIVLTNGTNYYTLGLGKSAIFAFDYTTVNVAGTGAYTLTGAELNRVAYNFTGVLTGNRTVIVPNTVQQYWVTNSTTGAYSLTIKTASTSGVAVSQTSSAILYSNGTQVVAADTGGISIPIPIAQGGTGAITAGGALINLGLDPINGGAF